MILKQIEWQYKKQKLHNKILNTQMCTKGLLKNKRKLCQILMFFNGWNDAIQNIKDSKVEDKKSNWR